MSKKFCSLANEIREVPILSNIKDIFTRTHIVGQDFITDVGASPATFFAKIVLFLAEIFVNTVHELLIYMFNSSVILSAIFLLK